jgi:hypothetical protein
MEAEMKAIFAALASAVLMAGTMSSISTPVAAQMHGGGFHGGGGSRGGGFRGGGGGGFRAGGFHGGGFHGGGFRGGHHRDRDGGIGLLFGLPYGDPYYYDDPSYYDDTYGYDDDASPACGSWSWDTTGGRYVWIPC